MKTTIFLCRHGETDWNREERFQGQHDIELNKEGIKQSELLGRELARHGIDVIFSSPKKRALKTAEIVSEKTGAGVVVMEGLRERSMGIIDGKTKAWYRKHYPESYRIYDKTRDMPGIKGAEGINELAERAFKTMEDIARENKGKNIAVITHGALNKAFIAKVTGMGIKDFRQNNCCINILKYDGKFKTEKIMLPPYIRRL